MDNDIRKTVKQAGIDLVAWPTFHPLFQNRLNRAEEHSKPYLFREEP